jgi:hypothetical protein
MRLLDQPVTADVLGVAALAALTMSVHRGTPFLVAARVAPHGGRLTRRPGSVPVR